MAIRLKKFIKPIAIVRSTISFSREVGGDVPVDFLRRMHLGDESERLRPFESSALLCGKRLSSLASYRKKAIFEN